MAQQLYIELAAHPQAILDSMNEMKAMIARIESRQKWNILFNILRLLLFIVGIALLIFVKNKLVGFVLLALIISSYFLYRPVRIQGKKRFEAAYRVIHTLRDDAGRKGRLIGHLDLSSPIQKSKLVRTGRTSSGRAKHYYRDPWFVARMKLADGNVIKVQMEDRLKEKRGSIVARTLDFQNKVIINPDVYEAVNLEDPARRPVMTGSGSLGTQQYNVQNLLENLRSIYAQVRPITAQNTESTLTPGTTAVYPRPPEASSAGNPGSPPEGQIL